VTPRDANMRYPEVVRCPYMFRAPQIANQGEVWRDQESSGTDKQVEAMTERRNAAAGGWLNFILKGE